MRLVITTLALCLWGCSSGDLGASNDAGTGEPAKCEGRFMPIKMGASWTYAVRDSLSGAVTMKIQTVEAEEAVPMKPTARAYKLITRKGGDLNDQTISWQQDTGTAIVRHQENSFRPGLAGAPPSPRLTEWWEPFKLRIDERDARRRAGAVWVLSYKETSLDAAPGSAPVRQDRTERWTVEGTDVEVTVPAGTFKALLLRRVGTDSGAASDKRYWFVCNVGKVKETGGQQEDLVSYQLP